MSDDLLQLCLAVTPEQAENLESILWSFNALAVSFVDGADTPIFEPELGSTPLWVNTHILALFAQDANQSQIIQEIKACLPNAQYKFGFITTKNWERAWLCEFKPMNFGDKLWIVPSTYNPPNPKAVNLLLDPGLAFGTGTHPSTSLCLKWLDANSNALQNKQIIDYGCGSGVLAIAGLLLGAKHAIGFDIDLQALEASRNNAHRNNIADELFELNLANLESKQTVQADILVANILADPLIKLAPYLVKMVKSKGQIVLAGILQEQANLVVASYKPYASEPINVNKQDDWVRLSFKLK